LQASTQKRIGKVRPPRVQITYDVETGGSVEEKTLPLVVGVVADFAPGSSTQEKLGDRSFVTVDMENYDSVMTAISPRLRLAVPNRLDSDSKNLDVDLKFSALESFTPAGVAHSVPALAKLLQTRAKLNDLLAKLEGNERLNDLLAEVVNDVTVQEQAFKEIRSKDKRGSAASANCSDGSVADGSHIPSQEN
jgi:type VI secretion system protein ImpB